jgi:hypothetical protein
MDERVFAHLREPSLNCFLTQISLSISHSFLMSNKSAGNATSALSPRLDAEDSRAPSRWPRRPRPVKPWGSQNHSNCYQTPIVCVPPDGTINSWLFDGSGVRPQSKTSEVFPSTAGARVVIPRRMRSEQRPAKKATTKGERNSINAIEALSVPFRRRSGVRSHQLRLFGTSLKSE